MPSRFHEGARRSRLLDRKAARRRRGLDGLRRHRDQNLDRTSPGLYVHDCRHDLGSARFSSFSAWGVTRIILGILLVCRWSAVGLVGTRWCLLGVLVFGW